MSLATSVEGVPNSLSQVLSRIHPLAYGGELFWDTPLRLQWLSAAIAASAGEHLMSSVETG